MVLVFAFCAPAATGAQETQLRPWTEYRSILWMGESVWKDPSRAPLVVQRLKEMGINTGMVFGDGPVEPLVTNGLAYYVENMVNRGLCLKFKSKVTDWDKFVMEWSKNGRLESGLVRDYSLDDPEWLGWARREMQQLARKNRAHSPLAYDIRDELSTTISANPFDYDFSAATLRAFRAWLKGEYGELATLNRVWQTHFGSWDEVKPFTTDQVKNRMSSGEAHPGGKPDWQGLAGLQFDPVRALEEPTRWNAAPWADFRTYMDLSLARALEELRAAARETDPRTPVGVEGTQMPHAFGGYDLWRLSQALDWVEPYDIGCAREVFGSFMPGKPILSTVFEKETNAAMRRLWHLLLEGDRGCIIWWSEDCIDWKSPDLSLTAKGRALQPVLADMTSPLARLFLNAERMRDPIYIHYSQASIQVDWLLESTVDGPTWLRRFSSFEAEHNRMAKGRMAWLKLLQDVGYAPQFISQEQIEKGVLDRNTGSVLVLGGSYSLSDAEAEAIRRFLRQSSGQSGTGRTVLTDVTPGSFDEHCRLRPQPALAEVFPANSPLSVRAIFSAGDKAPPTERTGDISEYGAARLKNGGASPWPGWVQAQLRIGPPEVSVPVAERVRIHRFRIKEGQLLAFERNINYQMSEELKQAGGNEGLEKASEVQARLRKAWHAFDLRSGKYLGSSDEVRFQLLPWEPTLLGLTETREAGEALVRRVGR